MAINDEAGDLVVLIRHDGFGKKLLERDVRQRHPRRDHFLRGIRRNTRQPVAGTRRRGLSQQIAQVIEDIRLRTDGVAIGHGGFRCITIFGSKYCA